MENEMQDLIWLPQVGSTNSILPSLPTARWCVPITKPPAGAALGAIG